MKLLQKTMKEEIRPVIFDGIEIPGYFISNTGNVYSSYKHRQNSYGKFCGVYISEIKKLVKPEKKVSRGNVSALQVKLVFPEGLFSYDYSLSNKSKNTQCMNLQVHRLVMNAFKPIDDFPPERLLDCWDSIPTEAKMWIKQSVIVHHIDHNPENNHVDNLMYVTQRENMRFARDFYGGNVANKVIIEEKKPDKTENRVTLLDFV